MEEKNPILKETPTAEVAEVDPQTSPDVSLEMDNKEKPQLQIENPKLSALSLKLSQEDCMKFARLKVRCLVAEGRLSPGGYQLMIESYAKQVELCWYSRKIQRINALYSLHQLMRLKLEVTEELNAYKYRTQWVKTVLGFRGRIVDRITTEHRKLLFLLQFIDKKEFIKEDREVSDLVVGMGAPIWQYYLHLSEAQKYDYDKVLDDLLKTLVSSSEQDLTSEDLDGVHSDISVSLEGSSKELGEEKELTTIHITEKTPEIISAQSSNDQAPQSIMNQPVETVELHELARQENQVAVYSTLNPANQVFSGGLVQYYKRLCPFIARNGSHFKNIQSRKHFLNIIGKPIPTSLTEGVRNKAVISMTPNFLRTMKSRMGNILRRAQNKTGMAKRGRPKGSASMSKLPKSIQTNNNGGRISHLDKAIETVSDRYNLSTESQEKTTRDETQNTIIEKGTKPMSTSIKRRLKNKKSEKTISARFEHQLKQLCLTRKCVVMLERMKNYCQYESA